MIQKKRKKSRNNLVRSWFDLKRLEEEVLVGFNEMIVLSSSSLLVLYGNNLLRNIHPESLQRIQRFGAKNRRSISTSGSTLSVKKAHKQPRKPASTATATAPGRSKQKPLLSASPARKPLNAEPTLLPGKDEDRRTNYPPLVAAARAKTVNQRSVFESYLGERGIHRSLARQS